MNPEDELLMVARRQLACMQNLSSRVDELFDLIEVERKVEKRDRRMEDSEA